MNQIGDGLLIGATAHTTAAVVADHSHLKPLGDRLPRITIRRDAGQTDGGKHRCCGLRAQAGTGQQSSASNEATPGQVVSHRFSGSIQVHHRRGRIRFGACPRSVHQDSGL
ncbi:hypothetical protein ABN034_12750 [Actinopolymorpha sp. B11F2]|uniref:hypothetical protein n=1 Tax=Actinopolymorpha sp. B11F2 TaxID=3160862 RepID=UPI0032E41198